MEIFSALQQCDSFWHILFSDTGVEDVTLDIPHTITEWVGSGFCSNTQTGLGISSSFAINAFQPFFLSFTVPYSIIRGERVGIPVSVFNYLNQCLKVCFLSLISDFLYENPFYYRDFYSSVYEYQFLLVCFVLFQSLSFHLSSLIQLVVWQIDVSVFHSEISFNISDYCLCDLQKSLELVLSNSQFLKQKLTKSYCD